MVSSPALTSTPAASPDPSACTLASAPAEARSAISSSLYGSEASSARACSSETGLRRKRCRSFDDLGHLLFQLAEIIRGER